MPKTNTPQYTTYQTKQLPLYFETAPRLGTSMVYGIKDGQYLNCFVEKVGDKETGTTYSVSSRPGFLEVSGPSLAIGDVRFWYYWEDFGILVWAQRQYVYMYNYSTNTQTTVGTVLSTTVGDMGCTEFLYDDTSVHLVISDGVKLYTLTSSGTLTASTDADLPSHTPIPVFMDGYIFVLKTNSADLYGSDYNAPLSWSASNFISAEMAPDKAVMVAKLSNYIVILGKNSVEYFYDAGNATGSPLSRTDIPFKQIGYVNGYAQYGNKVYFIGNSNESGNDLYQIEDFKIQPMNRPHLKRILQSVDDIYSSDFRAGIMSYSGKLLYVFETSGFTVSGSWAVDLEEQLVYRYEYATRGYIGFSMMRGVNWGNYSYAPSTNATTMWYDTTNHTFLYLASNTRTDATGNFTSTVVTPNHTFSTMNLKTCARLSLIADRADVDMSISFSDDDYQTFSTPVVLNLDQELPCTLRQGRFRRRAYKFSTTNGTTPWRLHACELDLNMGIS